MRGYVYTLLFCAVAIKATKTYAAIVSMEYEESLSSKNIPKCMTLSDHARIIAADCKNYILTNNIKYGNNYGIEIELQRDRKSIGDNIIEAMEAIIEESEYFTAETEDLTTKSEVPANSTNITNETDDITEESNVNTKHGCPDCIRCVLKKSNQFKWHDYYRCVRNCAKPLSCCKGCYYQNKINPRIVKCGKYQNEKSNYQMFHSALKDKKSLWSCPTKVRTLCYDYENAASCFTTSNNNEYKKYLEFIKYFYSGDSLHKKVTEQCGSGDSLGQSNQTIVNQDRPEHRIEL